MKCLKDFINKTLLLIRTSTCKVILYWPKACSAAIPRTCTPARMHPHQHPQPTQPVRTQRVTHLIQQATSRPRLDPMRQFLVRNLRLMTQQPRPQKPIRLSEPLSPPVQGPGNYTAAKKQHFANAFEPSPFAHKEQNNPPGLSKRSGTDVLQGIANGVQAITGSIPILKSPAKKLWARLLKDKSFNVGDMVKLRQNTGGVNGQFGPFKISACHENNKYDIKRMDESIARENVSGNDLERW